MEKERAASSFGEVMGMSILWTLHLRSARGLQALADLRQKMLGSIPEGDVKQQVANELAPRRAIVQDAVVDVMVFAVVFLAASWLFGRVLWSDVAP